jgi:hypothetical protein
VEERVSILESYLKTISYAHCRQSFFEKFRRQAPVKSAFAKIIKNERTLRKVARNMVKRVVKYIEMDIISNTYWKYRLVVYYNML